MSLTVRLSVPDEKSARIDRVLPHLLAVVGPVAERETVALDVPPWDNAAMDGYAFALGDLPPRPRARPPRVSGRPSGLPYPQFPGRRRGAGRTARGLRDGAAGGYGHGAAAVPVVSRREETAGPSP